ncbi:MAG: thioredoxin family protein [Clostridiales bacterium]|nr:thioredoxin family protein [Clostridiales bacterium]
MFEVTEEKFDEIIYDEEATAVVYFHRNGCHVCRKIEPLLIAAENTCLNSDVEFLSIDAEKNPVFSRLGLLGVPQVLIFNEGQIKERLVGEKKKTDYIESIRKWV